MKVVYYICVVAGALVLAWMIYGYAVRASEKALVPDERVVVVDPREDAGAQAATHGVGASRTSHLLDLFPPPSSPKPAGEGFFPPKRWTNWPDGAIPDPLLHRSPDGLGSPLIYEVTWPGKVAAAMGTNGHENDEELRATLRLLAETLRLVRPTEGRLVDAFMEGWAEEAFFVVEIRYTTTDVKADGATDCYKPTFGLRLRSLDDDGFRLLEHWDVAGPLFHEWEHFVVFGTLGCNRSDGQDREDHVRVAKNVLDRLRRLGDHLAGLRRERWMPAEAWRSARRVYLEKCAEAGVEPTFVPPVPSFSTR